MAVAFNKFNQFALDLAKKVHALQSDTLKVLLTNTLPLATNQIKADITEIGAGNGYSAGGNAAAFVSLNQSGGVTKLILTSPAIWTASGGAIATFRWAVLYNDTPSSPAKPLIGWFDYGSALNLGDTQQFGVVFDATNGVLTIT